MSKQPALIQGHVLADEATAAGSITWNGITLEETLIVTILQMEAQLRLSQSCLWFCRSGLRQLSQSCTRKAVNYYELLGVKSDASSEEIKNAFFTKSKMFHPDKDPSNPTLHSQFVALNEAYRTLSKDLSRKEYDFIIRQPYSGGQAFSSSSSHTSYTASVHNTIFSNSTSYQENMRYWEQFHQAHVQTSAEERQRRKKNIHLLGYCIIAMFLSIGAHIIIFWKIAEVHTNFMNEKDRVITEIYNQAKERAKANGLKKQMEILTQNHAEFLKKYNSHNRRNGK